MMPATVATPITSPFADVPLLMASATSLLKKIVPSASAVLPVSFFCGNIYHYGFSVFVKVSQFHVCLLLEWSRRCVCGYLMSAGWPKCSWVVQCLRASGPSVCCRLAECLRGTGPSVRGVVRCPCLPAADRLAFFLGTRKKSQHFPDHTRITPVEICRCWLFAPFNKKTGHGFPKTVT